MGVVDAHLAVAEKVTKYFSTVESVVECRGRTAAVRNLAALTYHLATNVVLERPTAFAARDELLAEVAPPSSRSA